METLKPPAGLFSDDNLEALRTLSRDRYARAADVVSQELDRLLYGCVGDQQPKLSVASAC